MNSAERVRCALSHKQPDAVPIDFGSTAVTGMHVTCVAALREYYGLEKRPVKVCEPFQMLGLIEDDLKQVIGTDVESAGFPNNLFGFPNEDWKPWRLDCGLEVLVPGRFVTTEDERGNKYIYPQGDTSARPSGRMPKNGYFFDAVIRQPELDDATLNPEDNLEEFHPVTEEELAAIEASVRKAAATGRAVMLNMSGAGLGDIALVPGLSLKNPKGIRDVEEWYISTVSRRDYIHAVFDRQTEIAVANMKRIHERCGELIDVIFTCGTDFGTQQGTFCSERTFRELYMPYYKRVNGWIHANTGWKIFKHSCGAIRPFMELFIEAGFDVINPMQFSARGMDPAELKETYGGRLAFWGGGVDTQRVLPFGTPEEVIEHVLDRCEALSKGGGFVFNAVHNVQANTPVRNIVAMLDAVHAFNGKAGG